MSKNTDESVELETCLFKPRKQAVVYKFLIANVYSKMALQSNETPPTASQLPLLFKTISIPLSGTSQSIFWYSVYAVPEN